MLRSTISLLSVCSLMLLASAVADNKATSDTAPAATPDAAEIFKIQARIAAEQGDFASALDQIAQAAEFTGDRATADQARQMQQQVGGGAANADFQSLITLIQDQTSPPAEWMDIDQTGGQISIHQQGVLVTSQAVLKSLSEIKDDSNLKLMARKAAAANHNNDVRTSSKLRMVSVTRLEQHMAELLAAGEPVPEDMRVLAGLTSIEYLLITPETGDIIIAGPAGEWKTTNGQPVNSSTGRPTLQLDDFVALSRTFGAGSDYFLCTIDPKQGQVAAVQNFVNKNRGSLNRRTVKKFTDELEKRLGLQNVFVQGIPATSRVASVIVEADYRMKEVGIGKRKGADGMKSYFDLLSRSEQQGSSMDALRWWMAVGYDAVKTSEDGKTFAFSGSPVECLAEDQLVKANGQRQGLGKATKANAKFAELFTENLPALAAQDPVFADLENIFDMAMVAALIHDRGLATRVGWNPTLFADGAWKIREHEVPTELMTAANYKTYAGGHMVIQVAGGVRAEFKQLLGSEDFLKASSELNPQGDKSSPLGQQNNRWWWDAAE